MKPTAPDRMTADSLATNLARGLCVSLDALSSSDNKQMTT
jgi:hypothetical protein